LSLITVHCAVEEVMTNPKYNTPVFTYYLNIHISGMVWYTRV